MRSTSETESNGHREQILCPAVICTGSTQRRTATATTKLGALRGGNRPRDWRYWCLRARCRECSGYNTSREERRSRLPVRRCKLPALALSAVTARKADHGSKSEPNWCAGCLRRTGHPFRREPIPNCQRTIRRVFGAAEHRLLVRHDPAPAVRRGYARKSLRSCR